MEVITAKKRPVNVRAVKLSSSNQNKAAEWCGGKLIEHEEYPVVQIQTMEGIMSATVGDYIIEGVAGEFYPCKPEIFPKTYDYRCKCGKYISFELAECIYCK